MSVAAHFAAGCNIKLYLGSVVTMNKILYYGGLAFGIIGIYQFTYGNDRFAYFAMALAAIAMLGQIAENTKK